MWDTFHPILHISGANRNNFEKTPIYCGKYHNPLRIRPCSWNDAKGHCLLTLKFTFKVNIMGNSTSAFWVNVLGTHAMINRSHQNYPVPFGICNQLNMMRFLINFYGVRFPNILRQWRNSSSWSSNMWFSSCHCQPPSYCIGFHWLPLPFWNIACFKTIENYCR